MEAFLFTFELSFFLVLFSQLFWEVPWQELGQLGKMESGLRFAELRQAIDKHRVREQLLLLVFAIFLALLLVSCTTLSLPYGIKLTTAYRLSFAAMLLVAAFILVRFLEADYKKLLGVALLVAAPLLVTIVVSSIAAVCRDIMPKGMFRHSWGFLYYKHIYYYSAALVILTGLWLFKSRRLSDKRQLSLCGGALFILALAVGCAFLYASLPYLRTVAMLNCLSQPNRQWQFYVPLYAVLASYVVVCTALLFIPGPGDRQSLLARVKASFEADHVKVAGIVLLFLLFSFGDQLDHQYRMHKATALKQAEVLNKLDYKGARIVVEDMPAFVTRKQNKTYFNWRSWEFLPRTKLTLVTKNTADRRAFMELFKCYYTDIGDGYGLYTNDAVVMQNLRNSNYQVADYQNAVMTKTIRDIALDNRYRYQMGNTMLLPRNKVFTLNNNIRLRPKKYRLSAEFSLSEGDRFKPIAKPGDERVVLPDTELAVLYYKDNKGKLLENKTLYGKDLIGKNKVKLELELVLPKQGGSWQLKSMVNNQLKLLRVNYQLLGK